MTAHSERHVKYRIFTFLFTVTALTCNSARADWQDYKSGWYDVTNYEGYIGKYPIHLSLQKYEYYGSGLNIEGSYYYDNHMSPIPLYGVLDEKGNVSLCEIHSYKEFNKIILEGSKSSIDTSNCPLHLKVTNHSANGKWINGEKHYEVVLNKTASFEKTQKNTHFNAMDRAFEIPFWGQTAKHMFIGVYDFKGEKVRATIKVVNKHTRQVVQVLTPDADGCSFGFVMTGIYDNVKYKRPNKIEGVDLNCEGFAREGFMSYRLNKSSGKFETYDNDKGIFLEQDE